MTLNEAFRALNNRPIDEIDQATLREIAGVLRDAGQFQDIGRFIEQRLQPRPPPPTPAEFERQMQGRFVPFSPDAAAAVASATVRARRARNPDPSFHSANRHGRISNNETRMVAAAKQRAEQQASAEAAEQARQKAIADDDYMGDKARYAAIELDL